MLLGELPLALAAVVVVVVRGAVLGGWLGVPVKREVVGNEGWAIESVCKREIQEKVINVVNAAVAAREGCVGVSSQAELVCRQLWAVRAGSRQNRLVVAAIKDT